MLPSQTALEFFDSTYNISPRQLSGQLHQLGWVQPDHKGNAEILLHSESDMVFKLDDQSDMFAAYRGLADYLVKAGSALHAEHPHLPRIYRHRPDGVTLLERLQPADPKLSHSWAQSMLHLSRLVLRDINLEHEPSETRNFVKSYPTLPATLQLMHKLARRFGADITGRGVDILQRADGTLVMVDPLH